MRRLRRYRLMARKALTDESRQLGVAGVTDEAVIADVGCGPAAMSVGLAPIVGPRGRVIAVEREQGARAAARQVIAESGVGNVELREGAAISTGIEPGSVDVAMMRHVLAHNGGDEQAIVDHLASLVRPGGAVYLVDTDLTGIRNLDSDPDLSDLTERYAAFHADRGNDPMVGLRLGKLLAGGRDLPSRSTFGYVPPARLRWVDHAVAGASRYRGSQVPRTVCHRAVSGRRRSRARGVLATVATDMNTQ